MGVKVMKKKVAVLMGGISTEREVSLNSGKSVVDALDRDKYEVYEIILNDKMDVINKMPKGIEFAFLMYMVSTVKMVQFKPY